MTWADLWQRLSDLRGDIPDSTPVLAVDPDNDDTCGYEITDVQLEPACGDEGYTLRVYLQAWPEEDAP